MIRSFFLTFLLLSPCLLSAQMSLEQISSSFVLKEERGKLRRGLYERTIGQSFSASLDSSTEHRYQSAFWAVTQFMIYSPAVDSGFRKTIATYPLLKDETKRSFLEAIYTTHPRGFLTDIRKICSTEINPKRFAMAALFVLAEDKEAGPWVHAALQKRKQANPDHPILESLGFQILQAAQLPPAIPSLQELFQWQKDRKQKTVYSFQLSNRDIPGLAVIQLEDGRFVRDADGQIITIQQLARAASNLPYYLTNGNSPQGIYRIHGTAVSNNNFIGPTPNLQMTLPFEGQWAGFFGAPLDSVQSLQSYLSLLPPGWRSHQAMRETYLAGKAGRTEIIAHGTTIDPMYFLDKPFFPISPTLGCLCAREIWDEKNGKLSDSEQWKLIQAFQRTPGTTGYLMVINLGAEKKQVTEAYLLPILEEFERSLR